MPAQTTKDASALAERIAKKLEALRVSRDMSPEDLAKATEGNASASYIRRIEKCEYAVTCEMLEHVLKPFGHNLGTFFEDWVNDSPNIAARDRRYRRILQRALEDPRSRGIAETLIALLESHLERLK